MDTKLTETPESQKMDFDGFIDRLILTRHVAQATFLFKLSVRLAPGLLRTCMRYCGTRLDGINKQLPEDDPYRQEYERRKLLRTQRHDTKHQTDFQHGG